MPFNLPISVDNIDEEKILELTSSDKNAEGDHIKFIVLKKLGKAMIDISITKEEILAGIKEISFSEEDWND